MTKLKTLKDIPEIDTEGGMIISVNKLYVKQIGIDHIKKLNLEIQGIDNMPRYGLNFKLAIEDGIKTEQKRKIIDWIKYFFNITEEELK